MNIFLQEDNFSNETKKALTSNLDLTTFPDLNILSINKK